MNYCCELILQMYAKPYTYASDKVTKLQNNFKIYCILLVISDKKMKKNSSKAQKKPVAGLVISEELS